MPLLKHKGIRITVGEVEWTFAPLPVATLVVALPKLKELEAAAGTGDLVAISAYASYVAEVAHASLVRNYPTLTQEEVNRDVVDIGNLADVVTAVLDVSGTLRKAQDAGNWQPGGEPRISLPTPGPSSPPTSLPAPAGPGTP